MVSFVKFFIDYSLDKTLFLICKFNAIYDPTNLLGPFTLFSFEHVGNFVDKTSTFQTQN